MLKGHHVAKGKSYAISLAEAVHDHDINVAQIYVAGPRNYNLLKIDTQEFKNAVKSLNIKVYAHASHMTRPWNNLPKTINHTKEQLQRCADLGIKALIIHLPKGPLDQVMKTLPKIQHPKTHIYLEIPSIKHDPEMSWERPEQINRLTKAIKKAKLKNIYICVDTCHIWAAGTSLRTKEEAKRWIKKIKHPKAIKMIHLNDSYHPLGYANDQHAQLLKGHIWRGLKPKKSGLNPFVKFAVKNKIPMILERSGVKNEGIEDEYKILSRF